MKTWPCEHIIKDGVVWIFQNSVSRPSVIITVDERWKECPICLVPRPKEPMKLAEILREKVSPKTGFKIGTTTTYEELSQAALKSVFEVIDECLGHDDTRFANRNGLKQVIRERLG